MADAVLATLNVVDPAAGLTRLALAMRGERLHRLVTSPGAFVVQLKVVRAGGTRIAATRKVGTDPEVASEAQLVVCAMVFDAAGAVVRSRTFARTVEEEGEV
jgi:hypothetical protein